MSLLETIYLISSASTCAVGLIIWRLNHWRTINQAYAIVAAFTALWLFCIFMAIDSGRRAELEPILFWVRAANVCASFLPWTYALIKNAITESSNIWTGIKKSSGIFYICCLLAMLVLSNRYIPDDSTSDQQKRGIAFGIHLVSLAILSGYVLLDTYRSMRTSTGVRLLELKFFVLNVCVTSLAVLTSVFISRMLDVPILRYLGPFAVFISYGLTVWAISYHRVFDARQLFAALTRRLSTLAVLSTCVFLGYNYLSQQFSDIFSLIASSCVGGIIATIWDRNISIWLDLDPRRKLAKPRAQIIDWAREEADSEKLVGRFENFLRDWCQSDSVRIYTLENQQPPDHLLKTTNFANDYPILRDQGYITSETLARLRPNTTNSAGTELLRRENLGAIIAVPRGSHTPSCVVAFGHKQSLRPYTYPDIQLLLELVESMDNILAHSRVAAHAARLEKMESAAMMSRGLAHDLNNLTTPVSTFLLHMENRVKTGSLEAEVLKDAQHSIKVMQDYIRESLFFANRLAPDFHTHSSADLLDSVLKVTQQRAQSRGVTLVKGVTQNISLQADDALLCRLLQNLVFNGIDASPRGGSVSLSVTAIDKNQACFQVSDQGPGIPPAMMDRLFEPYFTTKDTGHEIRGLGLGLAISQKISALHSGEIVVSNAPGKGTIFSFTLPINPVRPNAEELAPNSMAPLKNRVATAASPGLPA